jgi:hypothetical protein
MANTATWNNSTLHDVPWNADSRSAGQEIPWSNWIQTSVRCRVHKDWHKSHLDLTQSIVHTHTFRFPRLITFLPSRLHLRHSSGPKCNKHFSFFPWMTLVPSISSPWFNCRNKKIYIYIYKASHYAIFSVLQKFLFPFKFKYSPQHFILKHAQSLFFP